MGSTSAETTKVEVLPATAERWPDLEALFGKNGACAGCWCMFWRLSRSEFRRLQGEGNKAMLKEMTLGDQVPGLVAYAGGRPAGWCSIGPCEQYAALERSRILTPVDGQPVWSIVCFFVLRPFRRRGLLAELVRGAVQYAQQHGAHIVEAYPIDTQTPKLAGKKLTGVGGYMGIASTFRALGFVKVGRASETQLIMRYTIQ
jgi:GNAT superfamily N-acetyltransferase